MSDSVTTSVIAEDFDWRLKRRMEIVKQIDLLKTEYDSLVYQYYE